MAFRIISFNVTTKVGLPRTDGIQRFEVMMIVSLQINCEALYTFNSVSDYPFILYHGVLNEDSVDRKYGHSLRIDIPNDPHVRTIQFWLFADLNFHYCYRIAIWERRLAIVVPLLVLCLGHWGVLYHGIIIVRAQWNDAAHACIVNQSNSAILKFTFFVSEYYSSNLFSPCCLSSPPSPLHRASCHCTHQLQYKQSDDLKPYVLIE